MGRKKKEESSEPPSWPGLTLEQVRKLCGEILNYNKRLEILSHADPSTTPLHACARFINYVISYRARIDPFLIRHPWAALTAWAALKFPGTKGISDSSINKLINEELNLGEDSYPLWLTFTWDLIDDLLYGTEPAERLKADSETRKQIHNLQRFYLDRRGEIPIPYLVPLRYCEDPFLKGDVQFEILSRAFRSSKEEKTQVTIYTSAGIDVNDLFNKTQIAEQLHKCDILLLSPSKSSAFAPFFEFIRALRYRGPFEERNKHPCRIRIVRTGRGQLFTESGFHYFYVSGPEPKNRGIYLIDPPMYRSGGHLYNKRTSSLPYCIRLSEYVAENFQVWSEEIQKSNTNWQFIYDDLQTQEDGDARLDDFSTEDLLEQLLVMRKLFTEKPEGGGGKEYIHLSNNLQVTCTPA